MPACDVISVTYMALIVGIAMFESAAIVKYLEDTYAM